MLETVISFSPPNMTTVPTSYSESVSYISAKSAYCADVALACTVLYPLVDDPTSYVASVSGIIVCVVSVPVSAPPVSSRFKLAEPVTVPVTAPVSGPVNAVAFTVPLTSNFVVGVVVPIPTRDTEPSKVIRVVVVPPSFILKVMSVSDITLETITPVLSTVIDRSLSTPICRPPSFTTPSVPDVVSFAFDFINVDANAPPNESESVAVPWNLASVIAVVSVIPFLTVANPVIDVLGVKVSSETIAIRLPSLNNFVIF